MSDATPEQETAPVAAQPEEPVDYKAKYEATLDASRKWETRAKENKRAADELAAFRQSQLTEEQRASERLVELERRAVEAEAKALRREIAVEARLSATDAALLDGITDEATMRAIAARLAVQAEGMSRAGAIVPGEGSQPGSLALNGDGLEMALRSKLGI